MKKIMMLMSIGLLLVGCSNQDIQLKKDTFQVEYGHGVSINLKDYIDTEDKDILKNGSLSIKNIDYEKDKEYPKVGTYDGEFNYKKDKIKFKVEIKDTTKPKFIDFKDTIKVQVNAVDLDLTKYFKAEDLSDTKITVESKDKQKAFDRTKEGSYAMKVTASDKYKNKTVKSVSVEVTKASDTLSATVEGTTPVNEETKKAQEQVAITPPAAPTTGNQGAGTPSTPKPNPVPPVAPTPQPNPDVCIPWSEGFRGMVFNSQQEAWDWGMNYITYDKENTDNAFDNIPGNSAYTFAVISAGCGKHYLYFEYE